MAGARRSGWVLGMVVAVALTVPAWLPSMHPLLDPEQVADAHNHALRVFDLAWLAEHGVWFPRWAPDLFMGYGYPLLNFYAPASYDLAVIAKTALHLEAWNAFRLVGAVAAVVATCGAYAFAVALWRRSLLGIVAAVSLLYAPYVFRVNLITRGDVPEAMALALAPWLLLALWNAWHATTTGSATAWTSAAALLGAGVILAHNVAALEVAALAAVWTGYLWLVGPTPRKVRLLRIVAAGTLAAGTAAYFWLPAIGETDQVQVQQLLNRGLDYHEWFVHLDGTGEREGGDANQQTRTGLIDLHLRYPPPQYGPQRLSLLFAVLAVCSAASATWVGWQVARRRLAPRAHALLATVPLLIAGVGCWLLTFSFSAAVWEHVPALPLVQFPWRLMGPTGLCIALAAAGAIAPLYECSVGARRSLLGHVTAAAAIVVVLATQSAVPRLPLLAAPHAPYDGRQMVMYEYDPHDTGGMGTTGREFLPRTVALATYSERDLRGKPVFEHLFPEADWVGGMFTPLAGDLRFLGWTVLPLRLSVRIANDGTSDALIGIRQAMFAGWRGWIDGRPVPLAPVPPIPEQQASLGFITAAIPPGEHTLAISFGPTPLRLAGMGITILSAAVGAGSVSLLAWRGVLGRRYAPMAAVWAMVLALAIAGSAPSVRAAWPASVPPPSIPAFQNDAWRAPPAAGAARAGTLLVNIAEAVRAGHAQVSSPSGASLGLDKFLDVRPLTVRDVDLDRGSAGESRRQWLYMHPPSRVDVDLDLPAAREIWLQASLSLDPAVWTAPLGDGVRYQVAITPPGTATSQMLLDEPINPRARTEQRRWTPIEVDLSPYGGQRVRLELRTDPAADLNYDWAGWGNPVVVVRESPRPRLAPGAIS